MPHFGETSQRRLATCDERLQRIMAEVVQQFDIAILQGHRGQEEQDEAHRTGKSKLRWPQSKHNKEPSLAVDVAPYPIDWNDRERFYYLAGLVKAVGRAMGIPVRFGGDWDSDTDFKDQRFDDLPHFELQSGNPNAR